MTPERQRIAIAQLCGWRDVRMVPITEARARDGITCDCLGIPPVVGSPGVPDYLNDLNALREVAIWLRDNRPLDYGSYSRKLENIVAVGNSLPEGKSHYTCDATPAQRCEAILRAVGRWEEETK